MKQIFTLLISLSAFATSFAQYNPGRRDDHYSYNQNSRFGHGNSFHRDRDFLIDKINRDYDFKIRAIQNDPSLRRHQKKVAIRTLERERERQISYAKGKSHRW